MPELPEVECVRRSLEPWVVGKRIDEVTVLRRDVVELPATAAAGRARGRRGESGGRASRNAGIAYFKARDLPVDFAPLLVELDNPRIDTGRDLDAQRLVALLLDLLNPFVELRPSPAHDENLVRQVVIELSQHLLETDLLVGRDGRLVAEQGLVDRVLQLQFLG